MKSNALESSSFVRALARPEIVLPAGFVLFALAWVASQTLADGVADTMESTRYAPGVLEDAPTGTRVTSDEYYEECPNNPLIKRHVWISGTHKRFYGYSQYDWVFEEHTKCALCGLWF